MNGGTSLESLSIEPTRRNAIIGFAAVFGSLVLGLTKSSAYPAEEISHTAESIHQEIVFKASRKRVYEALTQSKQFDQVVQLSDARKTMMPANSSPEQISSEAGGVFSMFGGLIVGRHIELVPNERIVQAWRPSHWKPGVYSIVKFELSDTGTDTKLILDHTGFPDGDAKGLLDGWNKNYWQPLMKYLA